MASKPRRSLAFIGDMGRDTSDELQIVHRLRFNVLLAMPIPDLTLVFQKRQSLQGQDRPKHVLAHPLGLRFRLGPDQAAKGEPSALHSPAFLSTGECGVNGSPGQGPGPLPPWTLKPVCGQERSAPPIRDSTAPGRRGAGGPRERRGPAGEHDQPLLPQSGERIRATLRLS